MLLDNASYAYMRTKRQGDHAPDSGLSLGEYIEQNDIDDPRVFFGNPGIVPDVKTEKVSKRYGYELKELSFNSFVETPHRVNNTVRCRMYEINGKPDAPAVIVLHGWQMESYAFFDYYCRLLVREGFNAVLVDLPYHMRRRAPKSYHGEYTFSNDAVLTIKVMKQAVHDVQGVINWLKEESGTGRVGTFGVSYGGMLAGLVGCVEPQVEFMMLVVPPVNLYEFFVSTRLGRQFRKRNPKMYLEVKDNRDLFEAISIENLKPVMAPENIFIVMAEYDEMVSPEAIDRLWYAWERPHIERYVHGHLSVILFNPSMARHMRRWLKSLQRT